MDINETIDRATSICEYCVDELEEKLDIIGIGLSANDTSEIKDLIIQIIEDNLVID